MWELYADIIKYFLKITIEFWTLWKTNVGSLNLRSRQALGYKSAAVFKLTIILDRTFK